MTLYPVILSGGSGSRLWPLSREHYPKPLLPLFSEKTLLQETASRLDDIEGLGDAVYVCNEEHRFLVAEQVAELGKRPATIILEPEGRKFSPHITLARLKNSPIHKVANFLAGNGLFSQEPFQVNDFKLYSSTLTPKGAIHRVEKVYPLTD